MSTVCHLASALVNNVTVVGGDANSLLEPENVADGSLALIVSNHPEPPFRLVSKKHVSSDPSAPGGSHLLTPHFLGKCIRKLRRGGMLVINTDSKHYSTLLAQSLSAILSRTFTPYLLCFVEKWL